MYNYLKEQYQLVMGGFDKADITKVVKLANKVSAKMNTLVLLYKIRKLIKRKMVKLIIQTAFSTDLSFLVISLSKLDLIQYKFLVYLPLV